MIKKLLLVSLANQIGLTDVLTYRPKAKEMFDIAISQLGTLLSEDVIDCCFQGIDICSVSFVDEFVINLQKLISLHENVLMRLINVSEEVIEDISAALMLRNEKDNVRMNLLRYSQKKYCIIGKLESNLQDTFSFATGRVNTSARDVAQEFNIEINSASNRLKKLYNFHLLIRHEVIDENGRQHLYFLPVE